MLVDALKGIPKDNAAAAIRGYANSIYSQAHQILRGLATASPKDAELDKQELEQLQIDAAELLHYDLVTGHEHAKMKFVTGIYFERERVIQRFLKRNKNKRLD